MSVPTITLNNGVAMPQLGFGVFQVPDGETTAAVSEALGVGYRSIDTAAVYGNESGVGRAIADSGISREDLFVTSKLWVADHGYDNALRAYDATLSKLGLDYLDLYLIHWPTPAKENYVETWHALETLLTEKRVKAIGVSNFEPEHLNHLIAHSELTPAVNQVELHPALQNRAVIEANTAAGVVTEAWSPLAQGAMLTNPEIARVAEKHGVAPAQAILRWHLQQGRVVIPKSVTPARIAANFDVFDFALDADDLRAIDSLDRDGRTGPHPDEFNG